MATSERPWSIVGPPVRTRATLNQRTTLIEQQGLDDKDNDILRDKVQKKQ
jgi:hypothetical protein